MYWNSRHPRFRRFCWIVVVALLAVPVGAQELKNLSPGIDLGFGVTYDSNDCGADPPVGTLFTWNLGTMASGTSPVCNVTVISGGTAGEISNTATIVVDNIDPNPADNSSTDAFTIIYTGIFLDNFETGDTSHWSITVP